MVKGTSKHIVVVKSPDPKVFEQAIFIVREDFFGKCGKLSALKEAQQVADEYIRNAVAAPRRRRLLISPQGWAALGISVAGILALAAYLIFF